MPLSRRTLLASAAGLAAAPSLGRAEPGRQKLKIGALSDFSGPYRDTDGMVATLCLQQAAREFMAVNPDFEIEIVTADHQNKPDAGLAIVREWFDQGGVDAIAQLGNTSVAIGCIALAQERDKVVLNTGTSSSILTGKYCSPNQIHWSYDTWCISHATATALTKNGGDKWYFVTADYTFGHALATDAMHFVAKAGGKVLGEAAYPFPGTSDFAGLLLNAQNSGANVIAFANSGTDLANCLKQAREFGLSQTGVRLAGMIFFITDVLAVGIDTAQGTITTETFYWDLNDRTRAFYNRLKPTLAAKTFPNMGQAGAYSAGVHYFKAVKEMGIAQTKASGRATVETMKRMPTDDDCFGPGSIRVDGRKLHPAYLFRVKKPNESKSLGDVYELLATVPADEAFRPLAEGGCSYVKI
jgi:branched-chain amino acid transport system substrate-binding protein